VNRYTVKIQRLDKDSDPLGDPIIRPDTMSESPSDAAKWACDQMLQSSHIPDHWDIEDEKSAGSVWFFVTDQCVSVEVFFCGIVEETKKHRVKGLSETVFYIEPWLETEEFQRARMFGSILCDLVAKFIDEMLDCGVEDITTIDLRAEFAKYILDFKR